MSSHIYSNQQYGPQSLSNETNPSQGQFPLCGENNEWATVLLGGFHLSPQWLHRCVRYKNPHSPLFYGENSRWTEPDEPMQL